MRFGLAIVQVIRAKVMTLSHLLGAQQALIATREG